MRSLLIVKIVIGLLTKMPKEIKAKIIENWEKEFENIGWYNLPPYIIKVIGYDKEGNAYNGRAENIPEIIRQLLKSEKEK